jgi:hypothetical protein
VSTTFYQEKPVLWIRIDFSADPVPWNHPDPDPGQTLSSQKVDFYTWEKGWNLDLFLNFG